MKIVTWNCNLNFAKKYEHIEYMDADICIILECEKLNENYFPNSRFFWTGRIENKGLGILIKNGSTSLDPSHNPDLINFLPIRSDNLKILEVWAYNHRAKKFGDNVSGETIQAIEFYKEGHLDSVNCIGVCSTNTSQSRCLYARFDLYLR
jgi:hypothetical protein